MKYNIMTVLINHRREDAKNVQKVLTKYGCNIKVRLGLHETDSVCAEDGLLVLQLTGEDQIISSLNQELNEIDGVEAKLTTLESKHE